VKTHLSRPFIRLATASPAIGKSVLFLAAHALPHTQPHWALRAVAAGLDYCVPVETLLGNGMKIQVVWADWVGADIRTYGYYEPDVVTLMEQLVKPGMVFIDAGAHVGQYTLLTAGLGASVHSFEPNPQTFQLLQYNVQTNALTNVRLNQSALAEANKIATLQAGPADNIGTCSLGDVPKSKNHFVVQCQSLDSYIEENRLTDVHVMKIDVEGSELHVLRGARSVLSRISKPQIIIEFAERNQRRFGFSCSQLGQFLTELGYELFQITDSGLLSYQYPKDGNSFSNVLARPKRKSSYVG